VRRHFSKVPILLQKAKEDGPVDHGRAPKQTWNVRLEPGFGGVVVGDGIQDYRSIDDPV
jgi:hypothetical protein